MVEKPEQPTPRSEDMNLEEDLPGRNGFFASEYGEWATYDYVDPATQIHHLIDDAVELRS